MAVETSVAGYSVNETGSTASTLLEGALSGFYEEILLGQSQATYANDTQYFHSTGTSTVTIGGNKVTVTTYVANLNNEAVTICGSTSIYVSFSISIGTPIGATLPLVTSFEEDGSVTASGVTTPVELSLELTGFSVA